METKLQMDVSCDMPMSIYLQPIIVITFVNYKLLRSKFRSVFKLVKDSKKNFKNNLDVRSFYFIQSVYTIYLCMGMAIYLFYLLQEVVNSERILTTNRFNPIEVFNHLKRLENFEVAEPRRFGFQLEREEVRSVYRLTSVYCVVICKQVNQDEDEVNLLIRIPNQP